MLDLTKLSAQELADLQAMVSEEIRRRLEQPAPAPGADGSVRGNSEGYWTRGCGADVAKRTAELVKQDTAKRDEPAHVKLYRTLEVLEYMSATLLVIDGAMYRIGCMGGDVEDRRPLMLLPVTMARAPRWSDPGRVFGPATGVNLEAGDRIKISGTVYEVSRGYPTGSGEVALTAVR